MTVFAAVRHFCAKENFQNLISPLVLTSDNNRSTLLSRFDSNGSGQISA